MCMYEENRPFGVVKDNMSAEVESYIDDLLSRSASFVRLGDTNDPESKYDIYMKERNLPAALACKALYNEYLRAEADGRTFVVGDGTIIKQRLIIIGQMIKDDVDELIQNTDFGFLEHMDMEEIKQELACSYAEQDIPAIVFYICAYSLHMKMRKISGVD